MVVGASQEMEFSGCLHRRVEEGMLGDGLVVERWRSGSVGVVDGVVWSEDGAILKVKCCGR